MSRVIHSFTEPSDGIENLVCGFMPDERFWVAVVVFDEVVDGCFQFFGGAVDAGPKPAFREQSEPAFPSEAKNLAVHRRRSALRNRVQQL